MRRTWLNLALLAAAGLVAAAGLALGSARGTFTGTDAQATKTIERDHSEYRRWLKPLLPSLPSEVESGLFAAQAALGAGAFGYLLGVLRERRRHPAQPGSPAGEPG